MSLPPRDVRVLVCDLDGTLMDDEGVAVPGLPSVVARLQRAGWPLVLCTGRAYPSARRLAAAAGYSPVIIAAYHGALVVDERTGRQLRHVMMTPRGLARATSLLRRCGLDLTYYMGTAGRLQPEAGAPFESGEYRRWATRVIALGTQSAIERALADVGQRAVPGVRVDHPRPSTLDVRHAAAVKDEGLRAAARALGVSVQETVAIGDGASDAAMLTVAGWGVAVGACDGSCASAADVVLAPENLADYLRRLAP